MTSPGGDEKWCYNNVDANCDTYGGLYQWDEAMNYASAINCDPCGSGGRQGLCPAGFHIPTDLEWSRYEFCLESTLAPTGGTSLSTFQNNTWGRGTNSTAGPGYKMKSTGSPMNGGNGSGFTGLGAGRWNGASFSDIDKEGRFWSATEKQGHTAWGRRLLQYDNLMLRQDEDKPSGVSVRCLQD